MPNVIGAPMASAPDEPEQAAARAQAWKSRTENLKTRTYAASQREFAALSRTEAAVARDEAARMRAEAARIRDDGARTRDEGARVRDQAAVVRDQAARARDAATRLREESLRARVTSPGPLDRSGWENLLAIDQQASEQSHTAANRDREAAELDRRAAERDREAAEHDRRAAAQDRDAAEKDREAADEDRRAADADRLASEADRLAAEREVAFAEEWVTKADRLISMGRLAATVAHELNNPLTALRLSLEAMRLELREAGTAVMTMTPIVDEAYLALDRLSAIVLDLRSWTITGGDANAPGPVDLARVVEQTKRLTSAEVNRTAKFIIDVTPTPMVHGIASRLGQVLTNLVLNAAEALHARPAGNEVRLSVRPVDGRARIEVHDTGAGIPSDVLPHIFDAFFTTKSRKNGTGLGLALSKRIIEEHRGTISVHTELGVGTTFIVDLPLHEEPSPASTERR
jgi:signal transduction histidine kinase